MHLANVIVSIGADDPPLLRFELDDLLQHLAEHLFGVCVELVRLDELIPDDVSSFESSASKAASTCHGVEVCVCECASVARGHAGA